MKMKPLFALLTSSVLATTALFASTNESPMDLCETSHSTSCQGTKRTSCVTSDQEVTLTQKRSRSAAQTAAHPSSPILLGAPTEVLFHLFSFLDKDDLVSLACTSKSVKDLALTYQLSKTSPTRVWSSALTFCQDTVACEKMRALFVKDVMPSVMETLLVALKTQTPYAFDRLSSRLDAFAGLESHGQTLGYRPLWQFLYSLKGAKPEDINPENFFNEGPMGDADRVFLNLLHYAKNNFEVDPKDLPAYDAPRNPKHLSPQALMHKASLLKVELTRAHTDTARAKILDKILETFDDLAPSQRRDAAKIYRKAAWENTQHAAKRSFYEKSVHMWHSLFAQDVAASQDVREAAAMHLSVASFSITHQEKYQSYATGAALLTKCLPHLTHDPHYTVYVSEAAVAHHSAAFFALTKDKKAYHFISSANLWDKLTGHFAHMAMHEIKEAAMAYQHAAYYGQKADDIGPRTLKSADLWTLYVEKAANPTFLEFKDAATMNLSAVRYANNETQPKYYKKSATFWDTYLGQEEGEPTLLDIKDAADAYQGAAIYTQNPLKKNARFLESARWWLLYLNQVKNPDLITVNRALSTFENAIPLTQDPLQRSAMKRYTRKLQAMNLKHQESWVARQ